MAVLRPLKLVIENYPEGQARNSTRSIIPTIHPPAHAASALGASSYIEQDDFMENPPKKFFRLSPGTEVRLRYAYFITCREMVKNGAGEVTELRCTYDPRRAAAMRLTAARSRPPSIGSRRQLCAGRGAHLQPAVCAT